MGNLTSSPFQILVLGLDGSGKTTVVSRLKYGKFISTTPTIGYNYEKFKAESRGKHYNLLVWDLSGEERSRQSWPFHAHSSEAVVFVVDSTRHENFEDVIFELHKISRLPHHHGVPFLILANKQDLKNAMSGDMLISELRLNQLNVSHPWCIHSTCAITGEGLDEALENLCQMIKEHRKAKKKKQ